MQENFSSRHELPGGGAEHTSRRERTYWTTAVAIPSSWGQGEGGFPWSREVLRENLATIHQKCRAVKKSITIGLDWFGQWKWEWKIWMWNLNLVFLQSEMSN